jgi:hypothetical protein
MRIVNEHNSCRSTAPTDAGTPLAQQAVLTAHLEARGGGGSGGDDLLELLGNERGAADEETIDVGLRKQLGGVRGLNGTAVDDARRSSDLGAGLRRGKT